MTNKLNNALGCDSDAADVQTHPNTTQTASSGCVGAANEGISEEVLREIEGQYGRIKQSAVSELCTGDEVAVESMLFASLVSDHVLTLIAEVRRQRVALSKIADAEVHAEHADDYCDAVTLQSIARMAMVGFVPTCTACDVTAECGECADSEARR